MTVEILRLSGLPAADAVAAAGKMISVKTGPRDLRNLLVVDDTTLLAGHGPVYENLDNAARVEQMLCVVVGPLAGNSRKLLLPGNLGGTQGSPVLWVSDPDGIDCRIASAAVAIGHVPGKVNGLDLLMEILSDTETFKAVHEALIEVPHRVANPGMRLTGQDDEAATFTAALVVAVRALCGQGPGAEGPFRELLPSAIHGASLAEGGKLASYRDEVFTAAAGAARRGGFGGRLRPGQADLHTSLVDAGAALADLREEVSKLLRTANTVGELSDNQRQQIRNAGIVFPTGPGAPQSARASLAVAEQPLIYRTVAKAISGGDALPLVSKRLTLTERELKHNGSGSYLPEVGKCCPEELMQRLTSPPDRRSRRGSQARPGEDLVQAADAARALANLVVTVAGREWSPVVPTRTEAGRIRAALNGTARALTEYADKVGTSNHARGSRVARLAEMLAPVLRDLVLDVVGSEASRPSATPLEALEAAGTRAESLIGTWVRRVQEDGISSQAPFPSTALPVAAVRGNPDDLAEIRETLIYQPVEEMWQLCGPDDLKNLLNLNLRPGVVKFASRLNKEALQRMLSGNPPAWTSSGSSAGLLRLVPLRQEHLVTGHVAAGSPGSGHSPDTEPA